MNTVPPVGTRIVAALRSTRPIWLLLGVVFLVHLSVAWVSRDGLIQDDAESYVVLARNLAAGHGYVFEPGRAPTSWRAPGYPALLAIVFWLTNGSLDAARVASACLWVLSALIAYALGRGLVGERPALVAAALVGLSPELVGMTGLLWSETLFVTLFLGSVLAIARWHGQRPSWGATIGTGLLIGAAVLTRSTAMVLVPVLWFTALTSPHRSALVRRASAATVAGLLVVGSWTIRNSLEHGRFVLVESNVGFNLYLGNSPDTPMPFAWKKASLLEGDEQYQRIVRGHSNESQSAPLAKAALEHMREHPGRTALLAVSKAFDFWLPDFFVARNVSTGSFGPQYVPLWEAVLFVTVGFYLLVVWMALRRVWLARRAWSTWFLALILALYTAPHLLVFGTSRHHVPLLPLVMILAAPELAQAYRALAHGRSDRRRTDENEAGGVRSPLQPC